MYFRSVSSFWCHHLGIFFYSSSNGTNNLKMHNILVNKFLASLPGIERI